MALEDTEPGKQTITAPLALPAPSSDTATQDAQTIDINAEQISALIFDTLGPMVVNSDGTLSRITNWDNMTELERERTMRVLNARNRLRTANEQNKQDSSSSEDTVTLASTTS